MSDSHYTFLITGNMKSLRYILLGIILLGILLPGFTHINRNGNGQTLVLQTISTRVSPDQMNASAEILSKRLKCLDIKHFKLEKNLKANQLILNLPGEMNSKQVKDLVLATGKLNFYPCVVRREALASLTKQPVAECTNKILAMLNLAESENFQSNFMLGMAGAKDTAAINHCLRSEALITRFPYDWQGLWSYLPNEGGLFELQMVNTTPNGINEQSIAEAKAFSSGDGINGITLAFKRNKWDDWKQLTAGNIDKALAIVIDRRVYSAPIVRSEIALGKAQITGSFTPEEARTLAAIISSGALPVEFEIK
jgi:preprotein translocase subunit SecD